MNLELPKSPEAEKSVIAACLLDPSAITNIQDWLAPRDFYSETLRVAYKAILDSYGEKFDITVLIAHLEANNLTSKITPAYILSLVEEYPGFSSNIEKLAKEVKNASDRRRAIKVLENARRVAYNNPDLEVVKDVAETGLLEITNNSHNTEFIEMPEAVESTLKEFNDFRLSDRPVGIQTGLVDLDRLIVSMLPGTLNVIAARPSLGKCLGKGTKVVMSDGTLKVVEDLVVGDQLLGPDSKPRNILSLARGKEQMYWVRQKDGIGYRVNESHILSLKDTSSSSHEKIVNISIRDYLTLSRHDRSNLKGYKVSIDLPKVETPLDPYDYGYEHATRNIEDCYLYNSKEARAKLLQGIMDRGSLGDDHRNIIKSESKAFIKKFKYLVDSLGYHSFYSFEHILSDDTVYGVVFYKKEHKTTDISIEICSFGDYYGFTLDGDSLFLLQDMTVTHNTALALCIAHHNLKLKSDKEILFFSLEMRATELVKRMVALDKTPPSLTMTQLQDPRVMSDRQYERFLERLERIKGFNLSVNEMPDVTVNDISSRAKRIAAKKDVGLVIIDYLQLINFDGDGAGGYNNESSQIGKITRKLKVLGRKLGCPIILLSQLNRSVESRPDKRPMLSDLRQSGAIEQDADLVLFLYREGYYNKEAEEANVAEIIIAKQRQGPTTTVFTKWNPEHAEFHNLDRSGRYAQ